MSAEEREAALSKLHPDDRARIEEAVMIKPS